MSCRPKVSFIPDFPLAPSSQEYLSRMPLSHSRPYPSTIRLQRRPRTSLPTPTQPYISPNTACPTAVFLPPGGIPPVPDDEEGPRNDDKSESSDHDFDLDPHRVPRPQPQKGHNPSPSQFNTIDRLLEETTPDYETWVDRNDRRSLTAFRGVSSYTLGAEELNESLGPDYLQRHRHVLAPDEAFGAVFNWHVIVANARELERLCWTAVAEEERLAPPDMEDIVRAEDMAPEAAVSRVFYWTNDWGHVKRLVFRKMEKFREMEPSFEYTAAEGVRNWLAMMAQYGVKCVLCAAGTTRARAVEIVRGMGLGSFFTDKDVVASEDEFESQEQMLLLAAVKASRPPGKCVVFTDKPSGITAGHEVSAKVIAVMGAHPAYEMKTADGIVADLGELVVYNVRRLFSEEGMEIMDPQTELERP